MDLLALNLNRICSIVEAILVSSPLCCFYIATSSLDFRYGLGSFVKRKDVLSLYLNGCYDGFKCFPTT